MSGNNLSRIGLFVALVVSAILSAGSAPAQEQSGGSAPAIEAPAPAPVAPAPAAAAPAPVTGASPVSPEPQAGSQPNNSMPVEAGPSIAGSLTLPHDLSPWG
ncbi:MAG: tonB-system energizer ExbB, partial [Mesorhizobium sp.]